jgi:hypothetical protein
VKEEIIRFINELKFSYSIKGRNSAARITLFLYVKGHLLEEESQEKLNTYGNASVVLVKVST